MHNLTHRRWMEFWVTSWISSKSILPSTSLSCYVFFGVVDVGNCIKRQHKISRDSMNRRKLFRWPYLVDAVWKGLIYANVFLSRKQRRRRTSGAKNKKNFCLALLLMICISDMPTLVGLKKMSIGDAAARKKEKHFLSHIWYGWTRSQCGQTKKLTTAF